LRQQLKRQGEVVSCGACYVGRLQLGNVVNKIAGRHPEVPRELFFSQEGMDQLAVQNPKIAAELRGEMGVRAIKPPESYSEVDGQILRIPQSKGDFYNSRRGLRWFSWSDFEVPHVLDAMQATAESAAKGLKGYAYTKVPNFAEVQGRTNLMINQSTMPAGATGLKNGRLAFDNIEGMPIETALRLRDKFPDTAGVELMGVSDAQIRAALQDPRIDTIIPFHRSGLSKELRDKYVQMGWRDYTQWTEEKMLGTGGKVPEDILEQLDWYTLANENRGGTPRQIADMYLDRCAKLGVQPTFPQFANEPEYYKLLVDMKQYNQFTGEQITQGPLEMNYDAQTLTEVINRHIVGEVPYMTDKVAPSMLNSLR
jgi:hypothetical protein